MPSPEPQQRVHQPAQLPLRAALISGPAVDSSFTGCCPSGPSCFSPGFSALSGPGGGPVPLTALLAGASHRAPATRFSPVPNLWGPAPPGPSDLRRASPIPGGSGATQCRLRLLSALTHGFRCHTFRETLSGLPLCLRPSASTRRRPAASRGAPAPAEGEGRPGPPQFSPGLSAPPGSGGNPVPLTALHAGASHRAPAVRLGPAPDSRSPAPPGPLDLSRASLIPGGPGVAPRRSSLFQAPTSRLQCFHFRETLSGPPHYPQPSARTRRRPTASREAPAPAEGKAAGLLPSLQPGSLRRSLQGSNGGPVDSRTGPQYAALTQALDFPEVALFFYRLMSAPPERGD
ncbi:hypothetical protein NDU88_000755 [Pleurodeles waltl]|uniref:Uncharacterized protein n=1 Tax=Pleurodeles waltl TaxID=8319 RepID=A0AAV7MJS7_PLEWA|nr:hypothetical protein NDU88_000755 [Pleurodeles waltl]